jgi:hypothetical protein
MKNFILIGLVGVLMSFQLAFADAPKINIVPKGTNIYSSGVKSTMVGPAYLLIDLNTNELLISYGWGLSGDPIYAGIILNGRNLPDVWLHREAHGALLGSMSLNEVEDGKLEIYFFNSKGQYDSDYGQNYQFTLSR